jgi:hypothetical protein
VLIIHGIIHGKAWWDTKASIFHLVTFTLLVS